MALEIERKFLVNPEKWTPSGTGKQIVQAYLNVGPQSSVRVRIKGEQAFLTIKGRSETFARPEFEYEIPLEDARELLKLSVTGLIEKIRYAVDFKGFLWEVDVFQGKNSGLLMAEIELEAEAQEFPLPGWVQQEVTGDIRYFNSYLSQHPFQSW